MRGFLDALGVPPQRVPAGVADQAALYRSLIAGKRMLVVADNARDAQQVRPLLPGTPTVVVLVTSRDQLTGLVAVDGAHPITIATRSAAQAHEIIEKGWRSSERSETGSVKRSRSMVLVRRFGDRATTSRRKTMVAKLWRSSGSSAAGPVKPVPCRTLAVPAESRPGRSGQRSSSGRLLPSGAR